jgi:hypothetical protein
MFGCDSTVPLCTSMSASAWERGILRLIGRHGATSFGQTRARLFAHQAPGNGPAGGGNRIRTIGPTPAKGSSGRCQSETAARKAEPLTGSGPTAMLAWSGCPQPFPSRRDREFESVLLHRRVCKPSAPLGVGYWSGGKAEHEQLPVRRRQPRDARYPRWRRKFSSPDVLYSK